MARESKKCKECDEAMRPGRSDKQFCSDQCRSAYNNRRNSDATNEMRCINNLLRKNRRILANFILRGMVRLNREQLIQEGFCFKYFTHLSRSSSGEVYNFCYELGYFEIGENEVLVVRNIDC